MTLVFTGSVSSPLDILMIGYEIAGLSPQGIPARHRLYGIFEFPLNGVIDTMQDIP